MSNAMENGAGIAANAISQASFVPMHTVDSRTDKFNGGPSPVGTSREGKMPEVRIE